jgi:uncharacterized membrane protein
MKFFSEKSYHELFEASIVLKAILSGLEIACGITLSLITSENLNMIVSAVFGNEMAERPQDAIWTYLFHGFNGISPQTQSLWAFLLLSHGIAKIIPLVGIFFKKLWAYPFSAAVFAGFVVYQIMQITQAPSVPLEAITIFDIIVIVLILHEYKHLKAIALKN